LIDNAERFGIDPARIVIAGDSSGANLALVAAIARRDSGETLSAALGSSTPFFPALPIRKAISPTGAGVTG
jgi:acetyl esterase/lipase